MSDAHVLRCYQYVTSPYEDVRAVLLGDARGVFQRATTAASTRARSLVSTLHVKIAGLEIGADVAIETHGMTEETMAPGLGVPRMRISLTWRAANASAWFPIMSAELSIYPLSKDETQLDFAGRYEPPLGLVGQALDAIIGHRIAEASVHRFVEEVAMRLRREVGDTHARLA